MIFLGYALFWFGAAFGMFTGSLWENNEQAQQCLWALGMAVGCLFLAGVFRLAERAASPVRQREEER